MLPHCSLSFNKLDAKASKHVADGLEKSTALTSLDLAENYAGPELGVYIAEALKVTQTLKSLNLSFNKLDAKASKYIAESLEKNTALTSLDLDGHPLQIKELKGEEPVKSIDLSRKGLQSCAQRRERCGCQVSLRGSGCQPEPHVPQVRASLHSADNSWHEVSAPADT